MYRKNYEGTYLKCLNLDKAKDVLSQFHDKYGIGHGLVEATMHQILRSSYYWPILFKDTQDHVKTYFIYQTNANIE